MKLKKLIAGVSALALALTTLGISAFASDWDISKNTVKEIGSLAALETFRDDINALTELDKIAKYQHVTMKLTCDIDLSGVDNWTPINSGATENNSSDYHFAFDGDNHTIKNMTVKLTGRNAGFFGDATNTSISNLKFENANVTGTGHIAVVAGHANCADFYNCHVNNSRVDCIYKINGDTYSDSCDAGGITGYQCDDYTDYGHPENVNRPSCLENCTVTNSTIKGYRCCGALTGALNASGSGITNTDKNVVKNNTASNVTVYHLNTNNCENFTTTSAYGVTTLFGADYGYHTFINNDGTDNVKVIELVDTEAELKQVISALKADTVVTTSNIQLNSNIEVTSSAVAIPDGKTVTIDLNGKTLSGASSVEEPLIVDNGGTLIIGGGTVSGSAENNETAAIKLTQKNTYNETKTATLIVNDGTYTGTMYAICGNGQRQNTSITINGGTFKATRTSTSDVAAIYQPQLGTLTINGGYFESPASAVTVRRGDLTITGGTFKSTATEFKDVSPYYNGATTYGAAVAIVTHSTNVETMNVNITGGTFDAQKAIYENTDSVAATLDTPINNINVPIISATTTSKDTNNEVNTDSNPTLGKTYIQYNKNGKYDQLEVKQVTNTKSKVTVTVTDANNASAEKKVAEANNVIYDGTTMTFADFVANELPKLDGVTATLRVIITDIPLNKSVSATIE